MLKKEEIKRGSNDLGTKLKKNKQLTVLKGGRQQCEQTSSVQGLHRMHAGIFPILFLPLPTEAKK